MSIDWVTMLGNISRSLNQVSTLVTGIGYILGILLVITALLKFRDMGGRGSHGNTFVPVAYLLVGSGLIFLRSSLTVLSNTTFGAGNVLQYSPYSSHDFYNSMIIIMKTAGIIWFVRGCMLIAHSSEPGVKFGGKGLLFVVAGILTINFEATLGAIGYVMDSLLKITGSGAS